MRCQLSRSWCSAFRPQQRGASAASAHSGHIWTPKRAKLLAGRVGMLVYIFYNSRVVNRLHGPVVQADWDTMAKWLAALPLTAEQLTTISWVQPSVANSSGGEQPEEEEGSEGVPALELYEFL